MRFTDAEYLNDPLELRFGRKMLAAAIEEEFGNSDPQHVDDESRSEIDALIRRLRQADNLPHDALSQHEGATYVACFSRKRDSLTQWRNYSGGRGYALGFDQHELTKMLAPVTEAPAEQWEKDLALTPRLFDVKYGKTATRAHFAQIGRDIVAPLLPNTPRRYLCELALATAKQKAYRDEREVRAIFRRAKTPLELEFRAGAMGVTPYITANYLRHGAHYDHALIREVMVGPGPDTERRRSGVEQLLRELHFAPADVPVSVSTIKFRG